VLRYCGYAYDAASGLYYCSARYYDPETRLLSAYSESCSDMNSESCREMYSETCRTDRS